MKANEMDAINKSEKATAMMTMNVGPRGMTPARVFGMTFFKALTGSNLGLDFVLGGLLCFVALEGA